MIRSTIKNKWDYRSMLVGNTGYVPFVRAMIIPGEGTTQIASMAYDTQVLSLLSATVPDTNTAAATLSNGQTAGYMIRSNAATLKFVYAGSVVSILSSSSPTTYGTYPGVSGHPAGGGYFRTTNNISSFLWVNEMSSLLTDVSGSSSLIGAYGNQSLGRGQTFYLHGGTPAGPYYYGGMIKVNTSANNWSTVWTDTAATQRGGTSGLTNGTTAGYIGGGQGPYGTYNTSIIKCVFATDTSYSTLMVNMNGRTPGRGGNDGDICGYYVSGTSSPGSSVFTTLPSIAKFSYATETVSDFYAGGVWYGGRSTLNT